jgi:hypothetical protein
VAPRPVQAAADRDAPHRPVLRLPLAASRARAMPATRRAPRRRWKTRSWSSGPTR